MAEYQEFNKTQSIENDFERAVIKKLGYKKDKL